MEDNKKSPQVAGTTSEEKLEKKQITVTTLLDGEIIARSVENRD